MKLGNSNLTRFAATAALGVSLMGTAASCGDGKDPTGISDCVKGMYTCETKGFVEGNASITGVQGVDGFFQASLNFTGTANELATNLKTEFDGLKADLEITDEEVTAAGKAGIAGAVVAKLKADYNATIKVDAEPPRCDIDAHASVMVSAQCQAEANCEVDATAPMASFECHGSCDVKASAMVDCGATAEASCKFKGPDVACTGSCSGTCTVDANVAAGCTGTCSGNCTGKCDGTCSGGTDKDGNCKGSCSGTCTGTCDAECKIEGGVAANCTGKCSGECTVTGPKLDCTAAVEAHCDAKANASVMCDGECNGSFTPLMVLAKCDAKASCDAQAKADASLKVECHPPSLDVKVVVDGTLDATAKAKLDFKIASLKGHLVNILVSLKKGGIVVDAGADLVTAGEGAVDAAVKAFASDEKKISLSAKYKLVSCAPAEFKDAAAAVKSSLADLKAQVDACASLEGGLSG